MNFRDEIEHVINKYSRENGSDTPDFILAEYLANTLDVFDRTVRRREQWYGRGVKEVADSETAAQLTRSVRGLDQPPSVDAVPNRAE